MKILSLNCLEATWIIEDIGLIRDSFSFISFHSIPLQCNHAALALASATKENEKAIIWLEECPFFFFPIVQSDFIELSLLSFSLQKIECVNL